MAINVTKQLLHNIPPLPIFVASLNKFCMNLIFDHKEFSCDEGVVKSIFYDIVEMLYPDHAEDDSLIFIFPSPFGHPQITNIPTIGDVIFITTKGDYWCQFAYQFAHEFCHYRIHKDFSGGVIGLTWLEETICELSSQYCLFRLSELWRDRGDNYYTHLKDYALDLVRSATSPELPLMGYVNTHLEELQQPIYHRDLYANMAVALLSLPLFYSDFWELLPYFGDMKQESCVETFLQGLLQRAPEHLKDTAKLFCQAFL